MNFNRREFIAASALLGAAAALAPKLTGPSSWFGGIPSGAGTLSGLQILRSAQPEPETFEKGLRASLEGAGMDVSKIASRTLSSQMSWKEWQALTAMAPGTMLVGMVSEAEFILVNELFREKGARVLSQGNHQIGDAARTRHAFTTSDASAGLGGVFAQWLKQGRQHALVLETSTRKASLALQRSGKTEAKDADWSELLGRALAEVALGRWEPGKVESRVLVGSGDAFSASRAGFVSFVASV